MINSQQLEERTYRLNFFDRIYPVDLRYASFDVVQSLSRSKGHRIGGLNTKSCMGCSAVVIDS